MTAVRIDGMVEANEFCWRLQRELGSLWSIHLPIAVDDFIAETTILFSTGDFRVALKLPRRSLRDVQTAEMTFHEIMRTVTVEHDTYRLDRLMAVFSAEMRPISQEMIDERSIFLGITHAPPMEVLWRA